MLSVGSLDLIECQAERFDLKNGVLQILWCIADAVAEALELHSAVTELYGQGSKASAAGYSAEDGSHQWKRLEMLRQENSRVPGEERGRERKITVARAEVLDQAEPVGRSILMPPKSSASLHHPDATKDRSGHSQYSQSIAIETLNPIYRSRCMSEKTA